MHSAFSTCSTLLLSKSLSISFFAKYYGSCSQQVRETQTLTINSVLELASVFTNGKGSGTQVYFNFQWNEFWLTNILKYNAFLAKYISVARLFFFFLPQLFPKEMIRKASHFFKLHFASHCHDYGTYLQKRVCHLNIHRECVIIKPWILHLCDENTENPLNYFEMFTSVVLTMISSYVTGQVKQLPVTVISSLPHSL